DGDGHAVAPAAASADRQGACADHGAAVGARMHRIRRDARAHCRGERGLCAAGQRATASAQGRGGGRAVGAGFGALLLAAALLAQPLTQASAWPERTVTIITPTGAGGGSDTVARIVAEQMAKRWQHPVIVENHPGADGIPAIVNFLGAPAAHTVLF